MNPNIIGIIGPGFLNQVLRLVVIVMASLLTASAVVDPVIVV